MKKQELIRLLQDLEDHVVGQYQVISDSDRNDFNDGHVMEVLDGVKRDIYDLWNGLKDGDV